MNNGVSFINYKCEILIQSCKSIWETNLTGKLLLSMTDRPSTTMLKRKEDMRSLYCITQETLKSGHGEPLTKTTIWTVEIQALIHICQDELNLIYPKILSKKSHEIESKALWKSS